MALVFLHPVGLDGRCWLSLTSPDLDSAIRYTLPWHGDRPEPAGSPSLSLFARDVVENVHGPLDLVGLSMGGAVALRIAIDFPERVRSLFIACSSSGSAGGTAQEERAVSTLELGMEGTLASTLTRWFSEAALDDPDHPGVAYARETLLGRPPRSVAADWRALAANTAYRHLSEISAPTTVLRADEDAAGTLEASRAMAEAIPGARFVRIPGPHIVHLENPSGFQEAVLDHLDWVVTRAGAIA